MRKNKIIRVRLSDEEYKYVYELARQLNPSEPNISEVIRTLIRTSLLIAVMDKSDISKYHKKLLGSMHEAVNHS